MRGSTDGDHFYICTPAIMSQKRERRTYSKSVDNKAESTSICVVRVDSLMEKHWTEHYVETSERRYQEGGDQVLDVAVVSVSTDTRFDCIFDSNCSTVRSTVLSVGRSVAPLVPRTKPTGPFLVSAIHPPPTNNSHITASPPLSTAV